MYTIAPVDSTPGSVKVAIRPIRPRSASCGEHTRVGQVLEAVGLGTHRHPSVRPVGVCGWGVGARRQTETRPGGEQWWSRPQSGRHETHSTSGHMWATSQRVAAVTTGTAGVPTHRRAGQGIDRGVNLEGAIRHTTEATKYRFQVSVAMAQASSAIHGSDAASAHVRQHGAAQLHGRGQVHARTRSHSSSDSSWSATNPSNTPAAFASLLRASSCL